MQKSIDDIRWETMLRVLRDVEERELPFDISQYGYEGKCGTVCCAAGWMLRDADIRRLGLEPNEDLGEYPDAAPLFAGSRGGCAIAAWLGLKATDMHFFSVASSFYDKGYRPKSIHEITCRDVRLRLEAIYERVKAERVTEGVER